MPRGLRLGTRGSELALTQSKQVAEAVHAATGVPVEVIIFKTRGDRIQNVPLPEIGGKGLFTAELEAALIDGSIDFAVHSLKDLPTDDPPGLILGAIPKRVDPRDAMVGCSPESLSQGAVVASGSLRRRTQIQAARPDVQLVDIRGNVPTRIRKRDDGLCSATVLAMAGLLRLGIEREDIFPLAVDQMVPAVGQGALGVQCRAGDDEVLNLLRGVEHSPTRVCVVGERAFLAEFGGGCNVPAGCHIYEVDDAKYQLLAVVADDSGSIRRVSYVDTDPTEMGLRAAHALK